MTDAVAAAPAATTEAPATPAAPAAPATPPAPAPASTPQVEAPQPDAITPVEYPATGDVGLDLALAFVGRLGISPDHPAMKAADEGNFDLIKAHLATLGDKAKGWEQHVALAEKAAGEFATRQEAAAKAITTAVHDAVGGEDTWKTISAWASKEATKDEKSAMNSMLNAGPIQARAAAMLLSSLYDQATGVVREPANPVDPFASGKGNPAPATRLTRSEAVQETNKLAAKVGTYGIENRPEYRAIWARVR